MTTFEVGRFRVRASLGSRRPRTSNPSKNVTSVTSVTHGLTLTAPKQPQLDAPRSRSPINTGTKEVSTAMPIHRDSGGSRTMTPATMSSAAIVNRSTNIRSTPSPPHHLIIAAGRWVGLRSINLSTAPAANHKGTTTRASATAMVPATRDVDLTCIRSHSHYRVPPETNSRCTSFEFSVLSFEFSATTGIQRDGPAATHNS